jgi:predicted nucleotidyltransferase component of viral defense system
MRRWQFYLVGGTALAIYFGHRRSLDLDWFTEDHISDPLRLAQDLRDEGVAFRTGHTERGTLHGAVGGVRVSLLEYRYPLLKPPISWPEFGTCMASLADLACMKLSALAQRGSKKDFVDIYALSLKHKPLRELLRLYQQKYAVADVAHVLYGLAYFHDADKERMPKMLWDADWRTIKRTIQEWVREIAGGR